MPSSQFITFLLALTDLALGGLISNGFVVAMVVTEWAERKTLAAREQLILSVGTSNILFTLILIAFLIRYGLHPDISNTVIFGVHYFFLAFGLFSRLWVTAWLCVFYCIKIVNSTHSLFLCFKLRILRMMPWLLWGSLVITSFVSFIAVQNRYVSLMSNAAVDDANVTQGKTENEFGSTLDVMILTGNSVCPFLMILLCSILVVTSLCRHICRVAGKESKFRSPRTEAHVKAARTVVFLLFLSISFYVAEILTVTGQAGKNIFASSACLTVIISYSPVQAAILLSVNPKLKQAAVRMLPSAKPS